MINMKDIVFGRTKTGIRAQYQSAWTTLSLEEAQALANGKANLSISEDGKWLNLSIKGKAGLNAMIDSLAHDATSTEGQF